MAQYIDKNLVFEIVKRVLNLLSEEDKVKLLLPKISNDAPEIYEGFMYNLSDLYKFVNNEYKDKIVNVVLDNIELDNLIEAKGVDLEKEIDDWYNTMGIPVTTDALKETAKHFFEFGIKKHLKLGYSDAIK